MATSTVVSAKKQTATTPLLLTGGVLVVTAVLLPLRFVRPNAAWVMHLDPILSGGLGDFLYDLQIFRIHLLLVGTFLAAYLALPALSETVKRVRAGQKRALEVGILALTCVGIAAFLIAAGRRHFGGWDFTIIVETGWRQFVGQRPYMDFPLTTPPLFNVGLLWAYRLFGVSWNATLYAAAILAVATFLWTYALLRRWPLGRVQAYGAALMMIVASTLTLDFWWYNSTTFSAAAVLLAATLVLWRQPGDRFAQASFVVWFGITGLAKPNVAALTMFPALALLVRREQRRRMLLLLVAGTGLLFALLALAHISPRHLAQAYRDAAIERGLRSAFGWHLLSPLDKLECGPWILITSAPILAALFHAVRLPRQKRSDGLILVGLLLVPVVTAAYSVRSNSEWLQTDCALIWIGDVVALTTFPVLKGTRRRAFYALLLAALVSEVWFGAMRLRVYSVGLNTFFEWGHMVRVIPEGYLKDVHTGITLADVQTQVREAAGESARPVYLGPRIGFEYADLRQPSAVTLPGWWEPGTAFARAQVPQLIENWEAQRFPTLIFLRNDYTYYTPAFLDRIHREYTLDCRYSRVDVWHRRPDADAGSPIAAQVFACPA